MQRRKALEVILNRISEPGNNNVANFGFEEIDRLAVGSIAQLMAARLFQAASPADTVTCVGCDERCQRPVELVGFDAGQPPFARSLCHLYSDRGPFEHPLEKMQRWTTSRELVAKFIARQLGITVKEFDRPWRRVRYSTLTLGGARRAASLELLGAPIFKIGSLNLPLVQLIEWDANGIRLDLDALAALGTEATDTFSGNKRVQASSTIQADRKTQTELRNRRVQRYIDRLSSQRPNLSKNQLAKLTAKSEFSENMTASRIARVTTKPKKPARKNFA